MERRKKADTLELVIGKQVKLTEREMGKFISLEKKRK